MLWFPFIIFTASFYGITGDTKMSGTGIEQFWADDYKVFEKIYGKTSDRDIYGASLPASYIQGVYKTEASDKKERFHHSVDKNPNVLGNNDNGFPKQAKVNPKSAVSTFNFIKYDGFKPISETNDPETYKYLQNLEELEQNGFSTSLSFKPSTNFGEPDPKNTEAYKSIQDILDAHKNNKEKKRQQEHVSYGKDARNKPARNPYGDYSKRCVTGRCRNRINQIKVGPRPYIRRVKNKYIKH